MKRRQLFPEGRQIISIPFDLLPSLLQTLQDIPWVLPAYKPDGLEFVERLLDKLGLRRRSKEIDLQLPILKKIIFQGI